MTKNHAILFDLDGTLVDTALDFTAIANELRVQNGMSLMDDRVALRFRETASSGARAMMGVAFNCNDTHTQLDQYVADFLDAYGQNCARHARIFSPLSDFIEELDNQFIPWGVVTNKPVRFAKPLLHELNLLSRCHTLICPEDIDNPKPDPESILLAMKHIGLEPGRNSVYVGDHERDIASGRHAGLTTIAASYGYIPSNDNVHQWKADHVADSPASLANLLREHLRHL